MNKLYEERHNKELKTALEKLIVSPGQGSIFEQLDKIARKLQRTELYNMLDQVDEEEVEKFPITLYKSLPQSGKKNPMLLRFYLKSWRGYDDVFWQALGDYIIVALHRVNDVEYDSVRGKIKVQYFAKEKGRIKSPEDIRWIIQKLAFMVANEDLPTDFTRFRRMNERKDSLGEMSKDQAALAGIVLKLI